MFNPLEMIRLIQINAILFRHSMNRSLIGHHSSVLRFVSYGNPWSWKKNQRRGVELRKAFEKLGPLFVKFGQIISTRRDLFPDDIVDELSKLQDRVPPFSSKLVQEIIEETYEKSLSELFAEFELEPLASASVAQVHCAKLHTGEDVVVKILRPHLKKIIHRDVQLLYSVARLAERFWSHGKRLRAIELVQEFESTLFDELDLMREAANASLLRRNFEHSPLLYVPKIYWDYARTNILVMERIYGIPVSEVALFKERGVDLKKLSENGVQIFFTQVFRDSFFHADMHPGNIMVDIQDPKNPKYLGVDFGIMGTLSPNDQYYLAENFLAFFKRDYRRVAVLHVESGWIPANTRVDQFESAIRSVCEPIFERPLKDISFGQLLLRLFQTAERFDMEVQPQLLLLQKTLLNIEGLGRQLYPDLDLWVTAKPHLERWMRKQHGFKSIARRILKSLPINSEKLIQLPELAYNVLTEIHQQQVHRRSEQHFNPPVPLKRKSSFKILLQGAGLALIFSSLLFSSIQHHWIPHFELVHWVTSGLGLVLLLLSFL